MSGNQQPQGQQNSLSAFGFKPVTTSSSTNTSQSGGFGAFSSTPSVFGGGANTAQNNTTGTSQTIANSTPLFGSGGGIFGQTPNQAQSSAPSGGGAFGTPSTATGTTSSGGQTNSIFGTSNTSGSIGASSNSLFGGGGAKALFGSGATPSNPLGGIFGSQTSNQVAGSTPTPTAGNIFGNNPANTTPGSGFSGSGNSGTSMNPSQPSGGLFGGSSGGAPLTNTPTPSNGLLGASNTGGTSSAAASAPSLNIFGAAKNNTSSEQTSTGAGGTAPTSGPNPFSAFGAKPSTPTAQPGSSTTGSLGSGPALPSLFGGSNASTANTTNTTSSTPSSGLLAGLAKKPEGPPTPNITSNPSPFPGLGAPKDTDKEAGKDDKSGASAPPGGSLLGRLTGPADASKDPTADTNTSKDTAPKAPVFGVSLLGGAPKAAETNAASALVPTSNPTTAAPSSTPVPAPSTLRGKTVEDIVNQWTTELETHTREFSQFASEVAVWDRTLVENGNYISALYATVLAAESTQMSLDQSLDHVEQQQRQLAATLDQYEKSASEILHGPGGVMTSTEGLGLADSERDKSYALAANLYTQLDDLSRSLTQMVESVNTLQLTQGPSQGPGTDEEGSQDDPVSTIANILNAHLASLQWIDGSLREMEIKVKDAEKKLKDTGARSGSGRGRGYGLGSSRR